MTISVNVAGTSYTIPNTSDEEWGEEVTNWISAVSTEMLQSTGGVFTLTGEVDFGVNFGIKSLYYRSRAASPSTAGIIRLGDGEAIGWRDAGDTGDLLLTTSATGDGFLAYDGVDLVMRTLTQTLTNKTLTAPNMTSPVITSGGLTITGDIDVGAAGNFTIGASIGANNLTLGASGSTVVIPGDLQVDGTTTTVNSADLNVADANITVNDGGNDASAEGAGLTIERTATDGSLVYEDALTSKFKLGAAGSEVEVADVSSSQAITNKDIDGGTASDTNRITIPQGTKSALDALTRKEATIVYANDLDSLFVDDGSTLNEIGSGSGSGEINYIDNPDAESGIISGARGFYNDGAAAVPVDGTGGSASGLNFFQASSASLVIRGNFSFNLSKGAGDKQGMGFADTIVIDRADTNKLMKAELEYFTTANYVDGDIAMFVYDVDNAVLITPNDNALPGTSAALATSSRRHTVSWPSSDSLNYRIIWHITSTNASAWNLYFDSVLAGPGQILTTPAIGPWEDFTPAYNNNTGHTYSTNAGRFRRVGDSMEIVVNTTFTANGSDPGNLSIIIPNGLSTTATTIPSTVGDGFGQEATTTDGYDILLRVESSTSIGFIGVNLSSPVTTKSLNGNDFGVSNGYYETIRYFATIPISEWSGQGVTNALTQDNLSEWEDWTPTGSWVTNATYTGKKKRVGDEMAYQVYVNVTGLPTATDLTIDLPSEDVIDTSKFLSPTGGLSFLRVAPFGQGTIRNEGTNTYSCVVAYNSTTSVAIRHYTVASSLIVPANLDESTPFTFANTDDIYVEFRVPIVRLAGSQNSLVGFNTATSSELGLVKKNRWQINKLTSDITATTDPISDLTFNNLTSGRVYRVTITASMTEIGSEATQIGNVSAEHDGTTILSSVFRADTTSDTHAITTSSTTVFEASTTTLTFSFTESGALTLAGNNTLQETHTVLEELNNYEPETTDFT